MRAKSVDEIREHLDRGGRVLCHFKNEGVCDVVAVHTLIWTKLGAGILFDDCEVDHWELVTIDASHNDDDNTPEAIDEWNDAWAEKAERDFPVDFEKTWHRLQVKKRLEDMPEHVKRGVDFVIPPINIYDDSEFLALPITFDEYEQNGEWRRQVRREGTIAELLEVWDIDNESEVSEMAQVLRHLRNYVRGTK